MRRSSTQAFWQRVERFSPILCRLMARHRYGAPLTDGEIAEASGLTPHEVYALSWSTNWRGVDIYTMRKYSEACGLDFTSPGKMKRIVVYLQSKPGFKYLRRSNRWHSIYKPMIERWLDSRKKT